MFARQVSGSRMRVRRRGNRLRVVRSLPVGAFRFAKCTVSLALLTVGLFLSVLVLPIAALPAFPSLPVSSQTGGPWTNYSAADVLAADSILALDVAGSGELWVGTTGGVSVLGLGGDWLTLTGPEDDLVVDVSPDPASTRRHWFATYGGGTLLDDGGSPLDQTDDAWITFREGDGLVNRSVWTVAVDAGGSVWFGTNHIDDRGDETGYGVSVLHLNDTPFEKSDDVWTTFTAASSNLSHDVIRDIVVDGQGVVWIATQNGLNAYSDDTWTVFYTSDGLASNGVTALLVVDDLLWVATQGGVSVLDCDGTPHDKADDQWATYTQHNSGLVDNDGSSLAVDGAGRIWVGTDQKTSSGEQGYGVSVLDIGGTPFHQGDDTWATFNTEDGLAHDAVRAVMTAGSGTAWIGTREGLSHLDYGSSPFYEDDNHWRTYTVGDRLASNSVYAVAGFGAQWLGTGEGLSLLQYGATPHIKRDDRWTTYTAADGLAADGVRALAVDANRRVWIGTGAGLTVLDTGGTPAYKADDVSITYDNSSGLADDQVNDIVIDGAGRAWIGCGSYFGGGLHVLDIGEYVSSVDDDTWATFTPDDSDLPVSYVSAVALGSGNEVWLGTYGGAARLDHAGSPFAKGDDIWAVFTTGNSGLAYDTVRDVAVDRAGSVWLGLAIGGVSVCSSGGSWLTFTQSDGLAYDSVHAVAVDRSGTLWLGTDGGGVSVLDYVGTLMDKSDDVWTTYSGGDPLLSSNINAITVDDWGQVWLGTLGGGASVYSPLEFRQVYLPAISRNRP